MTEAEQALRTALKVVPQTPPPFDPKDPTAIHRTIAFTNAYARFGLRALEILPALLQELDLLRQLHTHAEDPIKTLSEEAHRLPPAEIETRIREILHQHQPPQGTTHANQPTMEPRQ